MVLLLSPLGAHGLDLSFVTHVFIMDEIWDKAMEEQVRTVWCYHLFPIRSCIWC
jgi:hypothetical protein